MIAQASLEVKTKMPAKAHSDSLVSANKVPKIEQQVVQCPKFLSLLYINSMGIVSIPWRHLNNLACPKFWRPKNRSAAVLEIADQQRLSKTEIRKKFTILRVPCHTSSGKKTRRRLVSALVPLWFNISFLSQISVLVSVWSNSEHLSRL